MWSNLYQLYSPFLCFLDLFVSPGFPGYACLNNLINCSHNLPRVPHSKSEAAASLDAP